MDTLEGSLLNWRFTKRLTSVLIAVVMVVILSDLVFVILLPNSPRVLNFEFDVDQEANLATWVNTTLDLMAGLSAFLMGWVVLHYSDAKRKRWIALGWVLIGLIFVYLSADDASTLHEWLSGSMITVLGAVGLDKSNMSATVYWNIWIFVLGIPGLIAAFLMLRFLYLNIWKIRRARWLVIIGFVLLVSNPLTELAESQVVVVDDAEIVPTMETLQVENPAAWRWFKVFNLIQEATEMLAVVFFLAGFLCAGEALLHSRSSVVDKPNRQPATDNPLPLARKAT